MCWKLTGPFRFQPPILFPSLRIGKGKSLPCLSSCKVHLETCYGEVKQLAPCPRQQLWQQKAPALPCRGAPSPHTSPRSALGSSLGRLSAEPGRRQSPCPGTQPLGHSRDPALHHSPGLPAAPPAAQPAAILGHAALRAVL